MEQTNKKVYEMHEQIEKSKEDRIDLLVAAVGFIPHKTKKNENLDGVDRWLQIPSRQEILRVDYKNDTRTKDTGNIFIETVSVKYPENSKKIHKQGWIYKKRMDAVFYNIDGTDEILLLPRALLEQNIDAWQKTYGTRKIPNKGYETLGVPVPLSIIKKLPDVEIFDFAQSTRNPVDRDGSWKRWLDTPYKIAGEIVYPPNANGEVQYKNSDKKWITIPKNKPQYQRFLRIFHGYMPKKEMVKLLREEKQCWRVKTQEKGIRFIYFGPHCWELPQEEWTKLRFDNEIFIEGLALHILACTERRAKFRYAFAGVIEEKTA